MLHRGTDNKKHKPKYWKMSKYWALVVYRFILLPVSHGMAQFYCLDLAYIFSPLNIFLLDTFICNGMFLFLFLVYKNINL